MGGEEEGWKSGKKGDDQAVFNSCPIQLQTTLQLRRWLM
jgi:hypothetical protein